jgi:hypothetical protein
VVAVAAACHRSGQLNLGEVASFPIGHLAIHCLTLAEPPKEAVEGFHFDHLQSLDTIITFFSSGRKEDSYEYREF